MYQRIIDQLVDRVYSYRCSIAHAKGDVEEFIAIPLLSKEKILNELPLLKYLAFEVIGNAYNCTPYTYYEKRRMQIAADLLNGSSQSVSDISAKLSFESPEYFSKCFKRHYGITPGQYRKRR